MSKIVHHFRKWIKNDVIKNVNNKKCDILQWKKIKKDSDNFWHRKNWLWQSNFGTFRHLPSPLTQFSKSNNFRWVCWFLGKNLSNFVPSVWRLHNPYCHNACLWFYARNQVMCQSWSKLKNCVESFFVLHIAEICKIKGYTKCCLHIAWICKIMGYTKSCKFFPFMKQSTVNLCWELFSFAQCLTLQNKGQYKVLQVWSSFLVWSPPWLYASLFKNKTKSTLNGTPFYRKSTTVRC